MSEFHDDYPHYETMSNHDEAHGKAARKVLWKVFWVMLFITIFELAIGSMAPGHGWTGALWLKVLFIGLTVVKAAAIVLWFMHLGHEVKFFKYIILLPYITFILYAIFIILVEGVYSGYPRNVTRVDKIFIDQQKELKNHHGEEAQQTEATHGEEHH
ncbi:MAG: cytochrome C oxidase subunit IV family protein [Bacteroidetes bacterium]|nr:cytochrome C oxidase subunit IV family protein [Bacteroidota bacterium]